MVGDNKIKAEYIKIRAARPGKRPPMIMPLPREIADELGIEVGETLAMYVDEDKNIRVVRPRIERQSSPIPRKED